jgi:hypothetical protein
LYLVSLKTKTLRYLITIVIAALSLNAFGQINGWELPWNPDANNDQLVGVTDLQSLLAVYGQIYSSDDIYVTSDSTHMLLDIGVMGFVQCLGNCDNLGSHWSMSELVDIGKHWTELETNPQCVWINTEIHYDPYNNSAEPFQDYLCIDDLDLHADYQADGTRGCLCSTSVRVKIEYDYCSGGTPDSESFIGCINDKLAEGWYPMSGFPIDRSRQAATGSTSYQVTGYAPQTHASFWRWAE